MGVIARLFRRPKSAGPGGAQEAAAAPEAEQGEVVRLGSEAAGAAAAAGTAREAAEGPAQESARESRQGSARESGRDSASGGAEPSGAEGVEIPKQQAAGEPAGQETGEGART
ncbi:hypothetical protein [Streptomyces sp. NPDC003374]